MSGLYVKLDVEYMTNPKLLEAGPLAELIYVRSLCFAKRTMRDGFLSESQTNLITFGVPSAKKHVKKLVDSGLWEAVDNGGYRIEGWLERNKSAKQIEREADRKRQASELANHRRWHEGPEGKPSPTCTLCHPDEDPKSDPKSDRSAESTESETETEEETKPESETETETDLSSSSSDVPSTAAPTTTETDERFEVVVALIADADIAEHGAPTRANPQRYRATCVNNLLAQHGPTIRRWLDTHPDATPELATRAIRQEISR